MTDAPVDVWTGDGRRRQALVRVNEANQVVVIPPGFGAMLLDPVTDVHVFVDAVTQAAEKALQRIQDSP